MNSGRFCRRLLACIVTSITGLCSAVFADDKSAPKEAASPTAQSAPSAAPGDVQDLIYLGGKHPILLRLRIRIGDKGLQQPLEVFSRELFTSMDKNKDQLLDETEAKEIPTVRLLIAAATAGRTIDGKETKIDTSPADGKISAEEFIAYVRGVVGNPFGIATQAGDSRQDVNLFSQLDADGNGKLSRPELENIPPILRRLDLDDDGILSNYELVGQMQYQAMFAPQASANSNSAISNIETVLQPLDRSAGMSRVVTRLVQRYDKLGKRKGSAGFVRDNRLSADELGVDAAAIKPHDKNGDGTLDSRELASFLENPAPQGELVVAFGERRGDDIKFQRIAGSDAANDAELGFREESPQKIALILTGVPMQLEGGQGPTPVSSQVASRRQFAAQFKQADQDNNGYLENGEFRFIGLQENLFAVIDRDQDKKVFEKELTGYLDLQDGLARNRVNMTFRHEGAGLLSLLDEDSDSRISESELRHAFERMKAWDKDGDGGIKLEELPSDYHVLFSIGPAAGLPNRRNTYATSGGMMGGNRVPRTATGPTWFVKMDRNSDGKVSQREFLGPLDVFGKLDTSSDGLLDPSEAEAAKAK